MKLTGQLSSQFRDLYFGGNWTAVNLKDTLANVDWQQATKKVYSFNTIAALVYHINYFVSAVLKVFDGEPLEANDKFSFDCPPITTKEDWDNLLSKTFNDAENFAKHIEHLPESQLWEIFEEEKYGNYYRNIQGINEHNHYHLGQIVLIKKLLSQLGNK